MSVIIPILATLIGYACGSAPVASIVCRLMGRPDPMRTGSRNPGATNVARIGGKLAGALVLLGDIGKVLAPMLIARALNLEEAAVLCVGAGAFFGHLFPPRRKGGKGVASFLGFLAGIYASAAFVFAVVWLGVYYIVSRYSSVAGMTASAASPIALWWLEAPWLIVVTSLPMVALILWRHSDNIRNLRAGTEN